MRESKFTKSIVTVVGARPQFIKAAAIARALQPHIETGNVHHRLIHTGQHYDTNMSEVFFGQLSIAPPDVHLGIGNGNGDDPIPAMATAIETALGTDRPDWVLIYGDTNTTLAAALAGQKQRLRIAHVEAGLRSFARHMPEERNRIQSDHLSQLLLCPTDVAVENLRREGITEGVWQVGDVMYDMSLHYRSTAAAVSLLPSLGLTAGGYVLATCHRQENTDDPERLTAILDGLARIGSDLPVLLPLHPRTARRIEEHRLSVPETVRCIQPIGYLEMLDLERNARAICTDSGGVQKEAYFCGVPCITMRPETEWVETVDAGWNTLVGTDADAIAAAADRVDQVRALHQPALYGDGRAAERIVKLLLSC